MQGFSLNIYISSMTLPENAMICNLLRFNKLQPRIAFLGDKSHDTFNDSFRFLWISCFNCIIKYEIKKKPD